MRSVLSSKMKAQSGRIIYETTVPAGPFNIQDLRSSVRGTLAVSRDGAAVAELHPEKRVYHASKMPMTESAIRYGLAGDLYVVLGDPLSHETWTVRIFHKPFVGWIWAGAMAMASAGETDPRRKKRPFRERCRSIAVRSLQMCASKCCNWPSNIT